MHSLAFRFIVLILTVLTLASCGSGSSAAGYGSLSLKLIWKHDPAATRSKILQSAAPDVCTDYGITQIYAYIRNSSNTVVAQGNWPCSFHGATITGVPAGTVSIQVDGLVGTNADWRGQQGSVTITANQDTNLSGSPIVMNYIGSHTSVPTVVVKNPAAGALSVSIYSNITASFSEDMAISSINENTFTVKALASTVCRTVSYNTGARMATCEPSAPLSFGTVYTATLSTGVTDMAIIPLASAVTWTFTSDSGIPVAPVSLSAQAGNGKVTLSWLVSNGATTYNIYSSTTQTVAVTGGNLVTSISGTSYVHSAANGTKRYYVITAQNAYGTSTASNEVFSTPGIYRYPIAITAGRDHSLALQSDGTVWAWGNDSYGVLGQGGSPGTNRSTPTKITTLSNVIAIAASISNSIALKSDGSVWAWGWNAHGQLGQGGAIPGTDSSTPLLVTGLSGSAVAIAAGGTHYLALKSDGTVWAWGNDSFGQLGNNATLASQSTPTKVSGLTNVVAIAAGDSHSLALKSDGTVYAWGDDYHGQLGDLISLPGTGIYQPTPVSVYGLTNVIAIAAGGFHSLALKSDGTVWAWGSDAAGQLGNNASLADSSGAVKVASLTDIVAIDSGPGGGMYSIALKSDGTVWVWGANSSGQLGQGGAIPGVDQPTPVQVPGLTNVVAVTAGLYFSMAMKSDGTIWSFGSDGSGQLGQGGSIPGASSASPVQVVMFGTPDSSQAKFSSSYIGLYFSIALKSDGTVWTWGNDDYGQLGDGVTNTPQASPVQVSGISNATAIAAGWFYAMALKADGTVWSWGSDPSGSMTAAPVQIPGITNVKAISAGQSHSMFLKGDGTVWTWGSNGYGQLGDGGANTSTTTPVQVSTLSDVIAISAGFDYCMALKSNGTIWTWGHDGDGQLGDGGTYTNKSTPVQVSGISSARAIAAGGYHAMALLNDGTVKAWGRDSSCQLGQGVGCTSTLSGSPVAVSGLLNVKSIAVGGNHSMALTSGGAVLTWGSDSDGQLGDGGTNTNSSSPVQVLTNVYAISAGFKHSMAIKNDGTTWTWGDSMYGQLGDGSIGDGFDKSTPVQVTGF